MISAWDEGELVGYAPFMESRHSVGPLSLPTLRFIGNNVGQPGDILYADILAAEPQRVITRAILHHAKANRRTVRWDLGYLDPASPSFEAATSVLGLNEWAVRILPSQPYVRLQLPAAWDSYLQSLSSKTRKNFRRGLRSLEDAGQIRIRIDRESDAAASRVAELIQSHKQWWRETPKAGWFGDDATHRFLVSAAALLADEGQYLAFTMEVDRTPIAWSAGAFDGHRYFEQLVSYDRTYASSSPGMVLSILLVHDLISMGVGLVELGPGLDLRKQSLGGKPTAFVRTHGYIGWIRRIAGFHQMWRRVGSS